MNLTPVLLALLLLGAAIFPAVWLGVHSRRRWLSGSLRTRLLVHTIEGQTLDGHLIRVDRDGIVLEPAKLDGMAEQLGGSVWVPRERIHWTQHPGPDA